jgi:hypothetical protein
MGKPQQTAFTISGGNLMVLDKLPRLEVNAIVTELTTRGFAAPTA